VAVLLSKWELWSIEIDAWNEIRGVSSSSFRATMADGVVIHPVVSCIVNIEITYQNKYNTYSVDDQINPRR
jgi:hypothetical protein